MFKRLGENDQLVFTTESEYYIAIGNFCNVDVFRITYEENARTGSYSDAYRMTKLTDKTLIMPLENAIRSKNRINCNAFVENLIRNHNFIQKGLQIYGIYENVMKTIPDKFMKDFIDGYSNYTSV